MPTCLRIPRMIFSRRLTGIVSLPNGDGDHKRRKMGEGHAEIEELFHSLTLLVTPAGNGAGYVLPRKWNLAGTTVQCIALDTTRSTTFSAAYSGSKIALRYLGSACAPGEDDRKRPVFQAANACASCFRHLYWLSTSTLRCSKMRSIVRVKTLNHGGNNLE